MHHRLIISAVGLVLTFGMAVPGVSADQTFHTERIPLIPVAGAPLHQGFVVDVHANGPKIFAQERYVLVGAAPNTTYQVEIGAYPDTACTQPPLFTMPEATLVTNGAGNGEAGLTFYATQTPPPPGTFNLQWHVLTGGTVAYQTACTAVAVD
ncbi:MAG TPA: hypothetical protein VHB98_01730 [Chloroflexota bacterium]|jgi:hypothetical protein|nr:hypothetical protein [Chloroflexota bacterium]